MFKVKINELPSLEKEPQITTSIKENPYKANVEIEKDELVIRPDLAAIYKAKGEKHSKGGIKTYLPDNSFVISDDKTLALNKEEHEMLELKMGGSTSPSKNTPADVLKRNLDVRHYNKMTSILTNTKKDEFSKRTAAMMLSKYEDVLGRVAFAQEAKKGFPTGLPEFSQDAAPVIADSLKENIEQQPQYMKKGGYTNPYMKMEDGGPKWLKAWRNPKTNQGKISSTGLPTTYEKDDKGLKDDYNYWKGIAGRDFKDASDYQSFLYDYNLDKDPASIATMWSTWGQTNGNKDKPLINNGNIFDGQTGAPNVDFLKSANVKGNFLDKPGTSYLGARTSYLSGRRYEKPSVKPNPVIPPPTVASGDCPCGIDRLGGCLPCDETKPTPGVDPNKIAAKPGEKKELQPWEFSSWQKANMAMSALDVASTRRDFAYRSQIKSPLVEMNRMNAQGALNNVDNSVYGALQSNKGLNPYMAAGNAASIFGKGLDGKQQVQNQYDNQNIGIDNQENQINNQSQKSDAMANIGFDQQYYRDSVNGRANFDNMKQTGRNRLREEVNKYAQDNQTLQYNMMTINNPAFGYDYKKGNFYLTGKDPMNAQTGQNNMDSQLQSMILNKLQTGTLTSAEATFYGRVFGKRQSAKKGGRINPYKK